MKRLTAFIQLILKQPDGTKAGAICIGNECKEGPVGTAIVWRLSALLLTRVWVHAALHHGISDHTADRHRSTDSKLKQALQRAQKEKNRERRHHEQEKKHIFAKLWCKAQFRAQNALTFLLVTIFTNYQNHINYKWSKCSHSNLFNNY